MAVPGPRDTAIWIRKCSLTIDVSSGVFMVGPDDT